MERDIVAIFQAVARGDASEVARLVERQPELARATNADTLSLLQFARYVGQGAILDDLIATGPPLDVFQASMLDRHERVKELIDADPTLVSAYADDGFTALHFAAYYGCLETARLLLDRGVTTEAVTRNFLSNMPLHAAAAGRRPETFDICELLLDRGANPNARQHGGFTPLQAAAQNGDGRLAELFLSHGADPTAVNDEGKTASDLAASQGHIELAALIRARASEA